MSSHVLVFAGVPLGDVSLGRIAAGLQLPWNMIPAHLAGVGAAGPPPAEGPIRRGERLNLLGFERTPTSLAWLAVVQRESGKVVKIPSGAAIKLGLTDVATVRRLKAQTTPEKIREDISRMERQAGLDRARHRTEVLDSIIQWVATVPWMPVTGVALATLEEVWPGAVAQIGEDILDAVCTAPLTAIPAWGVGACSEKNRTPWWVYAAVATGGAVALAVLIMAIRRR